MEIFPLKMKFIIFLRRLIKSDDESWGKSLSEIVVIIAIVLILKAYVFQFFRVSGPSMCPTLNLINSECLRGPGEFIFVNRWKYLWDNPVKGDVVVFIPPEDPDTFYIKRVLGVGGDTIEIRNGKLYLNNSFLKNHQLQEDYLSAINQNQTQTYSRNSFKVPDGKFLLFGDNRRESLDARKCFKHFGHCSKQNEDLAFVDKEHLSGKTEWVIWPINSWRKVKNELDYLEDLEVK